MSVISRIQPQRSAWRITLSSIAAVGLVAFSLVPAASADTDGQELSFADRVGARLIPLVEVESSYAGAYLTDSGTKLVVLSAGEGGALQDIIDSGAGEDRSQVEIRVVAWPQRTLREATQKAVAAVQTTTGVMPAAVSVDVESNRLDIRVPESVVAEIETARERIASELQVPFTITVMEYGTPVVCTSRANCYTPMKSGIQIDNMDTTAGCSMGFHATVGSSKVFLTAGHCPDGRWSHPGYGYLGYAGTSLFYSGGQDARIVGMPSNQQSDDVYSVTTNLTSGRNPIVNESIKSSLGETDAVDSGTVADDYALLYDPNAGFYVVGAIGSGMNAVPGDSGSPITTSGGGVGVGIMIHDYTNGEVGFTRLGSALSGLSATLTT